VDLHRSGSADDELEGSVAVEEMRAHPQRFVPLKNLLKEGRSPETLHDMAEHPERYIDQRRPRPRAVVERYIEREDRMIHWLSYAVFLAAIVPLMFGGKIYNTIEKVMVFKVILVLGFLTFLGLSYVNWAGIKIPIIDRVSPCTKAGCGKSARPGLMSGMWKRSMVEIW